MLKFILKRVVMMIPVLLGVALITFCMMYFSPGNAADYILDDMATEADKQLFIEENGLDQPFFTQFINYIVNAVHGDLGTSYTTKQPVLTEIMNRFPVTLKLSFYSMIFAVLIGVTLGIISAVRQYGILDNISRVVAMLGVSMPSFWEGLMLIILFSVHLRWLPSSNLESWKSWILPAFTLSTQTLATCMRMSRSSMLEAIREDYVRTARAKGASNFSVVMNHAFRNAMLPIITVVGTDFAKLLGGAAVIETVFSIPGIGKLIVDAINYKNAPLVQGGILFIAFVMSFINLFVDICYAYVDPRIRSQYTSRSSKLKLSLRREPDAA